MQRQTLTVTLKMLMVKLLFLLYVTFVDGRVSVDTTISRTLTAIECRTDSQKLSLQFYFKNQTSPNKSLIAECEYPDTGCYLVDQLLGKYYTMSLTDEGGVLFIIKDTNETRGKYTCCETFHNDSCASTDIGFVAKSTNQINSDRFMNEANSQYGGTYPAEWIGDNNNIYKTNVEASVLIVSIVVPCVTVVLIVAIIAGVYAYIKLRKQNTNSHEVRQSFQGDRENRLQLMGAHSQAIGLARAPDENKKHEDKKRSTSKPIEAEEDKLNVDSNDKSVRQPKAEEEKLTPGYNVTSETHSSTQDSEGDSWNTPGQSLRGHRLSVKPVIPETALNDLRMQDVHKENDIQLDVHNPNISPERKPLLPPPHATTAKRSRTIPAQETDV